MKILSEKNIIITGGSRGIGQGLVEKFAVNDSPQTLMKWDTKNYSGGSLSTGVYIVSLKTTTGVTNKKVLFLK